MCDEEYMDGREKSMPKAKAVQRTRQATHNGSRPVAVRTEPGTCVWVTREERPRPC